VQFSESLRRATVDAETDYGFQKVDAPLPLLLTAAERLTKPSRPIPDELESAKSKPYTIVTGQELSADTSIFGLNGSPTSVSTIYSIETKRKCEIIEGSTLEERVVKLTRELVAHGLFAGWKDAQEKKVRADEARAISEEKAFWVVAELV
jgi:electron transfer flavoprotein alpha/beta subunit